MPFEKVADDDYVGPSGRHFTLAQVRLYYSGGGTFEAGDAEADLRPAGQHPHKNLGTFLHKPGATMPAADAYSRRRAEQRRMDCGNGDRGPVPDAAGVGVDSAVGETLESQVPGMIPPTYQTADGEVVMNSRCELCGTAMSPRDYTAGKGLHCADCATKLAELPGAGPGVA